MEKYGDLALQMNSGASVTEQYFIDNLNLAINEGWIKAYHQPLIRAASGHVCDEEAFARWEDPERGIFTPVDFLPVLEREKLTYKLDLYMVERVLNKMKGQGEHGLFIVPESVNLAASDFESCDMVSEVIKRIDSSGLSRDKLSVELSERTISKDVDFMNTQIQRFQKEGVKVWMDDYGSGYSSLLILLKVKFNLLKIDKLFIDQIETGEDGKIIITELIKTALSLGMDTVAEGVETKAQADFLKEIGCTKLQGYYYTKPISLAQIIERNRTGIQIGFENPAEADYYEKLGRVSLYDLSFSRADSDGLNNYFDTMPMVICAFDDKRLKIIRSNKSFKEFEAAVFPQMLSISEIEYSSVKPGVGYYSFNAMRQCAIDGKRAIIDDRLADGRIIQLFLRRIAQNPVNGNNAVAAAILSITDKATDETLNYNYIARALSADYINLYFVDMDTEKFTEYSSNGENRDISLRQHGDHFFDLTRKEFYLDMKDEDKQQLIKEFTKENFIDALESNGVFSVVTKINLNSKSTFVSFKAVKVRGEGNYVIVGLNNVDEQIRNRELVSLAKEEKLIYSRIGALTGNLILLYTIDPVSGRYSKYSPSSVITDMGMGFEGNDFFGELEEKFMKGIYPEDIDSFKSACTKRNILNTLSTIGTFEHHHRLKIQGKPIHVILRAVLLTEEDQDKLIIGIINEDERVKREQEYQENLFAAENKANRDELTGVRNKHAYANAEEALNTQITQHSVSPFAIAVFDINGLKQVNDTLGHQAGDEFIKNGCSIICDFFKHSPVFRVGGDEFVVIAQGNDYNNADSIMNSFANNNEKHKQTGEVVIAAGISRFNMDSSVADVFKRADEAMYDNKRLLKEA